MTISPGVRGLLLAIMAYVLMPSVGTTQRTTPGASRGPRPSVARNAPPNVAQNSTRNSPQNAPAMRMGAVVRPDTVEVGDPFVMTVSLEVPVGARITWPTPADSNGPVALRASVRVSSTENGTVRRETAEYALVAWAVGAVGVALPDITVRVNNQDLRVPFEAPAIFVRSVLPPDTTLHVPKPAKGLFPRIVPWWELWWPVILVLLLLALLVWLAVRYRRRRKLVAGVDAYARAVHDFQRLDRLALADAGEQGRFVALALEVMRAYLAARVPAATLALTSDELLRATTPDGRVPTERLVPLLSEGDAIKFGQEPVNAAHAREMALEARSIVAAVEEAEIAKRAADKAAEKQAKRLEKKASQERRRQAEEQARRESRRKKSEAA